MQDHNPFSQMADEGKDVDFTLSANGALSHLVAVAALFSEQQLDAPQAADGPGICVNWTRSGDLHGNGKGATYSTHWIP